MSLRQLQNALARLFTDVDARAAYDRDPGRFSRAYGLDERERAQLGTLAENAIASYAAGLIGKRRAEALRLLPRVRADLGDDFARQFDAWASRVPLGRGPARYTRDAAAFRRHLLRERRGR
ncbi:MAG: hypothetical protein JOY98_07835 [Candidatus Eremiobacteraeota bacterium]|nr:hypothetical protein [Candidatus Eremiobacteraeota bacterium]